MESIAFVIFPVVYIIVTYFFKVIDHITDRLVEKTYKNKKGLYEQTSKSILFPILGVAPFQDVTPEFFDSCIIKWGVSRDFLIFKDIMGQSSSIEKKKLKEWESVFTGGTNEI